MIRQAFLAAAMVVSAAPALAGSVLYASDEKNIYTLNTANGIATLVGANGLPGFDDNGQGSIVRDLTSSTTALYGAKFTVETGGITGAVVTIDPSTGAITHTANLTGLLETGSNKGLYSIAYDNSTSTLFGNTAQRLYTIDPVTGAATFVGALPTGRVVGLGVDSGSNTLFAINQGVDSLFTLYTLSKIDATILTSVVLANSCACDIAFDPLTNRGYISSSFFDVDDNFLFAGLDALNPDLATTTFLGQHGPVAAFGVNGLAFLGNAVPEPESWAMMLAGFGMAGCAMRRRKRVAAALA